LPLSPCHYTLAGYDTLVTIPLSWPLPSGCHYTLSAATTSCYNSALCHYTLVTIPLSWLLPLLLPLPSCCCHYTLVTLSLPLHSCCCHYTLVTIPLSWLPATTLLSLSPCHLHPCRSLLATALLFTTPLSLLLLPSRYNLCSSFCYPLSIRFSVTPLGGAPVAVIHLQRSM
jgi:hypothetical protein